MTNRKERERDIISKIDDFLEENDKQTGKIGFENINTRFGSDLKSQLQEIADENNIQLSAVIRAFTYLAMSSKLDEVRNWLFNQDDTRELQDVLNNITNTKEDKE